MKVTLAIQRYNPETDSTPYVKHYEVEVEPTHRILDALMDITQNQDGTLGYRRSCAHGVCGSDAMRINGTEKLACKTLFRDLEVGDGGFRGDRTVAPPDGAKRPDGGPGTVL